MVAAAEMALASDVGVILDMTDAVHAHAFLFGEDQGRYLLATNRPASLMAQARAAQVPVAVAGFVGGNDFAAGRLFSIPLARLRDAHEGWMPAYMDRPS